MAKCDNKTKKPNNGIQTKKQKNTFGHIYLASTCLSPSQKEVGDKEGPKGWAFTPKTSHG